MFMKAVPLLAVLGTMSAIGAGLQVRSSLASPAPVGSVITWTLGSSESNADSMRYRLRVRAPGESAFRTVRDYGRQNALSWVAGWKEGTYEIEVSARNRETGAEVSATTAYNVVPRITGTDAVVTPTSSELVFLYSAPPCPIGSRMVVTWTEENGTSHSTPEMECQGSTSMNVYVAGMKSGTRYALYHTVTDSEGTTETSPSQEMETASLNFAPSATTVVQKSTSGAAEGILVQNRLFEYSVATDADGNVIWYIPQTLPYLVRPVAGGYFFALLEDNLSDDSAQLLRLIDLAGNVVFETNAERINEQLDALGKQHMTSFHHDARMLPDGRILVLAATERLLTDVQDPGEVAVLGDMILVLNKDLQVEWVWDGFDHLDVRRKALQNQKCEQGGGGCPVFRLAPVANDWLHGNSIALTPDGNIVYSARHQDWVVKIDYSNGAGDGSVIWRLGKDGDFRIESADPAPWFSHQHDANYLDDRHMLLFDNGNTRRLTDPTANSRGQVYEIDEAARLVRLVLNADLGTYAFALGSAQRLSNGNFDFGVGWTPDATARAVEVTPTGQLVGRTDSSTQFYRTVRMRDLYTP